MAPAAINSVARNAAGFVRVCTPMATWTPALACGGRQLLGFGKVAAQRPLAINVLACRDGPEDQFTVVGDFDGHRHEVHVGVGDQVLGIAVACLRPERLGGGVGRWLAARGHRDEFQPGQPADRRNV